MKYQRLGHSRIMVSSICLGSMTLGERNTWKIAGMKKGEVSQIIKQAYDAGINFFYTAEIYENGDSEIMLGDSIREFRDEVIIATKVRGRTGEGMNQRGNSRLHVLTAIRKSLERLQTDYIDLYQFHGLDNLTDPSEAVDAMQYLIDEGLVMYPGVSNFSAWGIALFDTMAKEGVLTVPDCTNEL